MVARADSVLYSRAGAAPDGYQLMLRRATWRSGYATVCKTVYPGSIPGVASSINFNDLDANPKSLLTRKIWTLGTRWEPRPGLSGPELGAKNWPTNHAGQSSPRQTKYRQVQATTHSSNTRSLNRRRLGWRARQPRLNREILARSPRAHLLCRIPRAGRWLQRLQLASADKTPPWSHYRDFRNSAAVD